MHKLVDELANLKYRMHNRKNQPFIIKKVSSIRIWPELISLAAYPKNQDIEITISATLVPEVKLNFDSINKINTSVMQYLVYAAHDLPTDEILGFMTDSKTDYIIYDIKTYAMNRGMRVVDYFEKGGVIT